jgi:hypothetical protein
MVRIFRVQMEHTKYGVNWSSKDVSARTAAEAIRKAQRDEPKAVRASHVNLIAEAEV